MSKPKLTQQPDGNIFNVVGACRRCLKMQSDYETVTAFANEIQAAMQGGETDYNGMLAICQKYVDFDTSKWTDNND